jgi:tyrosyl-tRNA synthetase
MDILDDLRWRGALDDVTNADELTAELAKGPTALYAGFDPTARSLHAGNLLPIIGLARFQRAGHQPIALAGGATGMVGDPSGKDAERELLDGDALQANLEGVRAQLERYLDFSPGATQAKLVNNYDWFQPIVFIDFLRDTGKHFSVNRMIQKESVKERLENREQGISYTEFSYMLLQAYDFLHLYRAHNCKLQLGGSDQWGNITAGIDLIRRVEGGSAFGLTQPLLTTSTGKKFGKSAEGEKVWLDPEQTSPYRFYQFWLRTEDDDVVKFLKLWTFLPHEEIDALAAQHGENPGARVAHEKLAAELTEFVHGKGAAESARRASVALFGGSLDDLQGDDWRMLAGEVPTTQLSAEALSGDGKPMLDVLVDAKLADSKGAARRDLKGGGVYLNGKRLTPDQGMMKTEHLLEGKYALLRKGKANYHLIVITQT